MTGHELLKRTPVRIAAVFTALFALTVITLFATLHLSLGAELERLIRKRVDETQQALAVIDAENGFDSLLSVVESESESVRDAGSILMLTDKAGAYKAGNVRDVPEFQGWRYLDRAALSPKVDRGDFLNRYLATWKTVSGGRLLVGMSDREIREMRGILLRGLGWSLTIIAALALLFGAYLAREAQQRIGALSKTLTAVSEGAVASRVPLTGSGDDMDHIAEQINRMLGHLQRLIENVNQASSDIAHDLKKPIGRLRQSLDRVQRGAKTMEDYRAAVESALEELDSINETFEALLRIAQIEAGARKARFSQVDLRDLVSDVADIYEAVVEDAGDVLTRDCALMQPALIRGDRELLTQLLANLIENAIRHCAPATRIGLSLRERDRRIVVAVTDDGPGIPADERANVFRRLYRLERARSTPGSGLGLSLVAAIAELHGAAIALADNEPGLRVELEFSRA